MNQKKKIFVTSDIHGYCTIFKDALAAAGFDKNDPSHLLVCCGDYFDRGEENDEVLSFLDRIENKVLIRGNHEDLLLKLLADGQIRRHHYLNGTLNTVENFFGKYAVDPQTDLIDFEGKTSVVNRIYGFIDEMKDYFETESYVFVHGWIPENGETAEGRRQASSLAWEKARWEGWPNRYKKQRPLPDKTLVCGHVSTSNAANCDTRRAPTDCSIYEKEGFVALDAGTCMSKRINILVIEDHLLNEKESL